MKSEGVSAVAKYNRTGFNPQHYKWLFLSGQTPIVVVFQGLQKCYSHRRLHYSKYPNIASHNRIAAAESVKARTVLLPTPSAPPSVAKPI